LTVAVPPEDTGAARSKRLHEEANTKESLCKDSGFALCEARRCQPPRATIEQGFCQARH
jgi:hypothetical protein